MKNTNEAICGGILKVSVQVRDRGSEVETAFTFKVCNSSWEQKRKEPQLSTSRQVVAHN